MSLGSFEIWLGDDTRAPHLRIQVAGYEYPEVAEPADLDNLICRVHASAPAVNANFDYRIRVDELLELRRYLAEINSGNGPPGAFALADGLFNLSFAPSRRGPVLCAVLCKSIDASHLRLELLVTLEPLAISRTLDDLTALTTRHDQ